ncbi:Transcription initiation factor TFIID subunit 10 [Linnemannia zychae]|nr:Transcription initiation factor TFIID subunit 10 [Linnemannia zychae]
MSDGSNSSHSTIEDTNMASPMPASGTSTPAIHSTSEADTNMTPAAPMDQDIPTPQQSQSQSQGPSSVAALPAVPSSAEQPQQTSTPQLSQDATPTTSSSTPIVSNTVTPTLPATAQFSSASPMTGVVSTSSPALSAESTTTTTSTAITAPLSGAPTTTTPSVQPLGSTPALSIQPPTATAPVASTLTAARPTSQQEELQRQHQQQQQLLILQQQAHLAQLQRAQETQAAAAANANANATSTPTPITPASATVVNNLSSLSSVAQRSLAVGAALQSRKEEELSRKDRTLAEFLPMMETFNPIIPDAVTDYYLSRTGFDCDDVRIKRLLALAAQKFVSDIATDAFQYCKVRQQSQKRPAPGKAILTMEDLSDALGEYGINVKKPDYFI